jgi:hypothetical protein
MGQVGRSGYHVGRAGHVVRELGGLLALYWMRWPCICWAESAGSRVEHTTAGRTLRGCLSKGIEKHRLAWVSTGLGSDTHTVLRCGGPSVGGVVGEGEKG